MYQPWNTHTQLPFSGRGYDRKTRALSVFCAETRHKTSYIGLALWLFTRLFFDLTAIVRSIVLINQPFELRKPSTAP